MYIANLLCIIHSSLSRLAWRAYTRRPCYTRHTVSGLAALCRMTRRSIDRADTLTRDRHPAHDRHDLPTSQPFSQYPAVSWELHIDPPFIRKSLQQLTKLSSNARTQYEKTLLIPVQDITSAVNLQKNGKTWAWRNTYGSYTYGGHRLCSTCLLHGFLPAVCIASVNRISLICCRFLR